MLSFGWFCVIWLVISIGISIFMEDKFSSGVDFFTSALIVSLVALIWCSIANGTSEINKKESVIQKQETVLSLKDSSNTNINGKISGNFIFTYGQVNSKEETFYRIIVGDNISGYQMTDLSIKETKLFFIEDTETPKLITENTHKEYKRKKNWLVGGIIKTEDKTYTDDEFLIYKLYIPKSAVKVEFNVDMK